MSSSSKLAVLAAGGLLASAVAWKAQKTVRTAPVARKQPHEVKIGEHTHVDQYYWMRDDTRSDPEIIEHLLKENTYCDRQMARTQDLQDELYKELLSHVKEDDDSLPYQHGPYYYARRAVKGLDYSKYIRSRVVNESLTELVDPEEVLDVNELAKGHPFFDLGTLKPSPSHRYLAYSFDTSGYETYTIVIKDLETGKLLKDEITKTSGSVTWGTDDVLYYSTVDEAHRPYKVHRHKVGSSQEEDVCEFTETDERFWVHFWLSRSGDFLFVGSESKVTSEVWFKPTSDLEGTKLALFQERVQDHEYSVEHAGSSFWILSNKDAVNGKLMRCELDATSMENWKEVIPHSEERWIEGIEGFQKHLIVYGRKDGLTNVEIISIGGGDDDEGKESDEGPLPSHTLKFDEEIFTCTLSVNKSYTTDYIRVTYGSLVTPNSVYDVDLTSFKYTLRKEKEVPKYDKNLYGVERIYAPARDGTKVPLLLVFRKDLIKRDASNFVYYYGYGAYGVSIDPEFAASMLPLLDRGAVHVIAHIRGGGENGRMWYENGKYLNKRNTFTDFIDGAEHLISLGLTEPAKLAISGGSAGGLLMGAVINMRPDLFKCMYTRVPFVDVMTTMSDPSIPLTVVEWEEWGNPTTEKYYEYMNSYSPYDNIKAQDYPHILITAGLNDSRVAYWEPMKYTAKLRELKTDNNMLLLKCRLDQGHGGHSARYTYLKEQAFKLAFVIDRLGM